MTAQTQVIVDWITGQGWDDRQELGWPLYVGPYLPPSPERLVMITGGTGPGYTTEEPATDASNFQALVRGPTSDPQTAEEVAARLDALVLAAHFPVQVDGTWIVSVSRLGSGPSPVPWDPGDERISFTSNYVIVTGV